MITVIEQTSQERQRETEQLFESIRPYLEQGDTYRTALRKIGRIPKKSNPNIRVGWCRHLIEYGTQQGFPHTYDKLGGASVKR